MSFDTAHVILPRNARNQIQFTAPSNFSEDEAREALLEKIKGVDYNICVRHRKLQEEKGNSLEEIVLFRVPESIYTQLLRAGFKNCIIYIGIDETLTSILTEIPEESLLAKQNKTGDSLPYISHILTL